MIRHDWWMYVCMHACMHVCTCAYVRLSVCLPAWLSVCMSACLPVCLSACLPVCLSACMPAWLSVCLSVCLFVCTHAGLHACTHARMHRCTDARMHVWMYTHLITCNSITYTYNSTWVHFVQWLWLAKSQSYPFQPKGQETYGYGSRVLTLQSKTWQATRVSYLGRHLYE